MGYHILSILPFLLSLLGLNSGASPKEGPGAASCEVHFKDSVAASANEAELVV